MHKACAGLAGTPLDLHIVRGGKGRQVFLLHFGLSENSIQNAKFGAKFPILRKLGKILILSTLSEVCNCLFVFCAKFIIIVKHAVICCQLTNANKESDSTFCQITSVSAIIIIFIIALRGWLQLCV